MEGLVAMLGYTVPPKLPSESSECSSATTLEQGPLLFASELDWGSRAANSLIESTCEHMKIGASLSIQSATFAVIEAMVNSDLLFYESNLAILIRLLFRTGPALDGMANPSPSGELTILLNSLRASTTRQSYQHLDEVDTILRVLGRYEGPKDDEDEEEEEEYALI